MSMKLTDELLKKLSKAASVEEAAEILKANGIEMADEDTQKLFQELSAHIGQKPDEELSLDELDAVSGGYFLDGYLWDHRDWLRDGCLATVEPKSWCGKSDSCLGYYVNYDYPPMNKKCPVCGDWMTELEPGYYVCRDYHSVHE